MLRAAEYSRLKKKYILEREERKKETKTISNNQMRSSKLSSHVFGVNTVSVQQKGNLRVDSNELTAGIKPLELSEQC